MSEMVERVARAICGYQLHMQTLKQLNMPAWQSEVDLGWPNHLVQAQAAIEAMREPTDLMGLGLRKLYGEPYRPGSHSATQIWRAMAEEALVDTPLETRGGRV